MYFNVGKTVSEKVSAGNWGENTVQELANFIASKQPELSGFNRRGLYRMKQFYETYHIGSECFLLWVSITKQKGSPSATQLQDFDSNEDTKVPTLPTQLKLTEIEVNKFVSTVLTQIQWSAHLHILNKTKTEEAKIFYLHLAINEKLSVAFEYQF